MSSINYIAISEPSWLSSNVSKVSGIEFQNKDNGISLSDISSRSTSSIQNKMELNSGSELNLNPLESKIISLLQPQYAFNSPINKTQYSFQSIFESQYGNYSGKYQNSKGNGQQNYRPINDSQGNYDPLGGEDYEAKGYYITIPQKQLNNLKSFVQLSPLQQRLKDTFSVSQNLPKGSLVNLLL